MEASLTRLKTNACKCRDLAASSLTPDAREILDELAADYDRQVAALESREQHRSRPAFQWVLG